MASKNLTILYNDIIQQFMFKKMRIYLYTHFEHNKMLWFLAFEHNEEHNNGFIIIIYVARYLCVLVCLSYVFE